jgi:hypothetical protein
MAIESFVYDFTKNTRYVSYLTSASILIIFILYFYPNLTSFIKIPSKFISIIILISSFIILFRNTNITVQNIEHIFVDPSLSKIKNNMLLSYLYSFLILVLIYYVVSTFFH